MNPLLARLHPYPFERLRTLLVGATPPSELPPINMGIGEPQHETPQLIIDALAENAGGLAKYPLSQGLPVLRESIARWIDSRYGVKVDPATEVLPVCGSREALFSFAQAVLDPSDSGVVLCPNPFYQIYEGAALMAGAEPYYVNCDESGRIDYQSVPAPVWENVRLVFTCSPHNPTGSVMSIEDWRHLFEMSDTYGFVIASDECYSEIYNSSPPIGALEAAKALGRSMDRIVTFSSLSKRSSAPGLRSGFVAGDAAILSQFLLYRTYHGTAMSNTVQMASAAAWSDENHVQESRLKYQRKFSELTPRLAKVLNCSIPDGSFFLWVATPISDEEFARGLVESQNVTVLPGTYLARETQPGNPGCGRVRIALVAEFEDCAMAIDRIVRYVESLNQ
jgi:N-succinyldiaminopimelate aminotransferase